MKEMLGFCWKLLNINEYFKWIFNFIISQLWKVVLFLKSNGCDRVDLITYGGNQVFLSNINNLLKENLFGFFVLITYEPS